MAEISFLSFFLIDLTISCSANIVKKPSIFILNHALILLFSETFLPFNFRQKSFKANYVLKNSYFCLYLLTWDVEQYLIFNSLSCFLSLSRTYHICSRCSTWVVIWRYLELWMLFVCSDSLMSISYLLALLISTYLFTKSFFLPNLPHPMAFWKWMPKSLAFICETRKFWCNSSSCFFSWLSLDVPNLPIWS